jgi:hypothetical protein
MRKSDFSKSGSATSFLALYQGTTSVVPYSHKKRGALESALELQNLGSRRGAPQIPPERTRIYCHAALDRSACAPFCKGKAHEVHQRHQGQQEIRGSGAEGSAVRPSGFPNSGVLTQTLNSPCAPKAYEASAEASSRNPEEAETDRTALPLAFALDFDAVLPRLCALVAAAA